MNGLRRATDGDFNSVVTLQQAAYAKNRPILGVEPMPATADYRAIFAAMEVWLDEEAHVLRGVLILEPRAGDMLIWSIATDPAFPPSGRGRLLLLAAEDRARALGLGMMRLYTGAKLTERVAWYGRHGYAIEREEHLADRVVVHMMKRLAPAGRR